VRKRTWEVLDEFGESVPDTVEDFGDKGLLDQWGTWFKHPHVSDYNTAMLIDKKQKAATDEKEHQLRETPRRKICAMKYIIQLLPRDML
jgi:hypothetical protein